MENAQLKLVEAPKQYRVYAKKFINWIKAKKIFAFTHRTIMQITGCNCPYSVLRTIKQNYEITEDWVKAPNRHKIYTLIAEINKNLQSKSA